MSITTYASLGLRPLINCRGTYTVISASLLLPEVRETMMEAATRYIQLDELMEKVGERLGELMQCEFGLVTNGCAAAICQMTSACLTGDDAARITQLPDTTGMKDEVLLLKSHQHGYNRAVRTTGARMIEVDTFAQLEAAIGPKTAMLSVFGDAVKRGGVSVAQMAELGKREGVPLFVDAAAERPDAPNRYLDEGADAVAYSGGKCLRGPQSSGLLLGRRDLLWKAFLNGSPHQSIGRPMKAGKEEIMGLLAAVEMWVQRDHEAEWKTWEQWLDIIWDTVADVPSITRDMRLPGRSNVAPVLQIGWDFDTLALSPEAAQQQLSAGEPRVEVFTHPTGVEFMPFMMEEGEAAVVGRRLRQILLETPS
jgi:uncharacterized pyridoxal phosphate-dependent enzyme